MKYWIPLWGIIGMLLVMVTSQAEAQERPLLIVAEESPPYEMLDASGKVVGIDVDVATYIFNKMGIAFEPQIMPWKRAWQMIQDGEADAAFSVSRNEQRMPYLIYPKEDMWVSEFVFFTPVDKKQSNPIGYEEAKRQKLRIGVIDGNSYHKSFWEAFPYQDEAKTILNPQLESANNIELNFRKLEGKRFDLFPIGRTSGRYELKRLQMQKTVTWYDTVLFSKGYPMPFVKKSTYPNLPNIAKQFEQELIALKKSGKYQQIVNKWL